jgi:hypothetical protein
LQVGGLADLENVCSLGKVMLKNHHRMLMTDHSPEELDIISGLAARSLQDSNVIKSHPHQVEGQAATAVRAWGFYSHNFTETSSAQSFSLSRSLLIGIRASLANIRIQRDRYPIDHHKSAPADLKQQVRLAEAAQRDPVKWQSLHEAIGSLIIISGLKQALGELLPTLPEAQSPEANGPGEQQAQIIPFQRAA